MNLLDLLKFYVFENQNKIPPEKSDFYHYPSDLSLSPFRTFNREITIHEDKDEGELKSYLFEYLLEFSSEEEV